MYSGPFSPGRFHFRRRAARSPRPGPECRKMSPFVAPRSRAEAKGPPAGVGSATRRGVRGGFATERIVSSLFRITFRRFVSGGAPIDRHLFAGGAPVEPFQLVGRDGGKPLNQPPVD